MTKATLGLRAHSGWAALVAVAEPVSSPAVIDRRRIELVDSTIPGFTQPYHAAEGLDLKEAEEHVRRCTEQARRLAHQGLRAVVGELRERGHKVIGCGILLGSGRPAPSLAATLASHALIHTAEGELFRNALAYAGECSNLPITGVRERELYSRGGAELGLSVHELQRQVAELGRSIGPPWRQDQKHAALLGWLALAAGARR